MAGFLREVFQRIGIAGSLLRQLLQFVMPGLVSGRSTSLLKRGGVLAITTRTTCQTSAGTSPAVTEDAALQFQMSLLAKISITADERSARLAGIGLMLLSVFMFSFGDALGKFIVATYSVGQLLLLRAARR